ncbi:MAG: hypothetical protein Q9227_006689 [Pyrenula ochraceoflavens]
MALKKVRMLLWSFFGLLWLCCRPPVLLVHGVPEHSVRELLPNSWFHIGLLTEQYTWNTIGPILASNNYTVIAPDNRGCGDSSLAHDDDYSAEAASADLKGVLDFLNITSVYVVSHDKGVGVAAALTANHRDLVKRVTFIEYPLPGSGVYEAAQTPSPGWTAYSNWQLAFFAVPDVPEFFLQGREKEYLTWYYYHAGYAGNSALSEDLLDIYTRAVQKPGFLRSAFKYFQSEWEDARFFNETIRPRPLEMPVLAMGGEASQSPISVLEQSFGYVGKNVQYDLVPKAGHWIGDENPEWVAQRVLRFFREDQGRIPDIDLSGLTDRVTLPQQLAMGNILARRTRRWQA